MRRLPLLLLILLGNRAFGQVPAGRTDAQGDPLPADALLRIGSARLRHGAPIMSLAFAANGKTLASCGRDHTVRLWEAATGRPLRTLKDRGNIVALSPDGRTLAAVGLNGVLQFWDTATGRPKAEAIELPRTLCLAFSPDGKMLATGGNESTVEVWDVAENLPIKIIRLEETEVTSVAFAPDGKTLATASRSVALWKTNGTCLRKTGRDCPATAVAYMPDGKTLVTARIDGVILLLDAGTLAEVDRFDAHKGRIDMLGLSADGRTLITFGADRSLRVWDVKNKRQRWALEDVKSEPGVVALSPDGKVLALPGEAHRIDLWDAATGKRMPRMTDARPGVTAVSGSPDGRLLATGYEDGTLRLCDAGTGKEVRRLGKTGCGPVFLAWLPDSKTILWGSPGQPIRRSDVQGKEIRAFTDGGWKAHALALSDDGRWLAVSVGEPSGHNHVVRILHVETGKEMRVLSPFLGPVRQLAFEPKGPGLALMMPSGNIALWDVGRSRLERMWAAGADQPGALAFAPHGRLLALWQDHGGILLASPATGAEVRMLSGHPGGTLALHVSLDGRLVVSGGADGLVRLWEVASGEEVLRLVGHAGPVRAAAFLPDRRTVVSGSSDGTVLVWDITGRPRRSPAPLSPQEFGKVWEALAEKDAPAAYDGVWRLALSPPQSMPLLREALRPLGGVERSEIDGLIADLDHPRFAMRQKARQRLERLDWAAEPVLRATLKDKPSLEMRRRVEELLARLENGPSPKLRALCLFRALQAIEYAGGAEARALLKELAARATSDEVKREAQAILARMK